MGEVILSNERWKVQLGSWGPVLVYAKVLLHQSGSAKRSEGEVKS